MIQTVTAQETAQMTTRAEAPVITAPQEIHRATHRQAVHRQSAHPPVVHHRVVALLQAALRQVAEAAVAEEAVKAPLAAERRLAAAEAFRSAAHPLRKRLMTFQTTPGQKTQFMSLKTWEL